MKRIVIFDMDGTLVDSSLLLANTINYVRSRLDLPPMPDDTIVRKINDPTIDPARYFYDQDRFEPIHEQWFTQYYSLHHAHQLHLYPGMHDLLRRIKHAGQTNALATNAYRISTVESLRHLAIDTCMEAVVCGDDVMQAKPAPDMLFRILEQTGYRVEEAVFVGDGSRDEAAADAAGIDYVMVDWGFTDHSKMAKAVRDVDALEAAINDV